MNNKKEDRKENRIVKFLAKELLNVDTRTAEHCEEAVRSILEKLTLFMYDDMQTNEIVVLVDVDEDAACHTAMARITGEGDMIDDRMDWLGETQLIVLETIHIT